MTVSGRRVNSRVALERLPRKIVQRYDAHHDGRQRRRDLRVAHIGLSRFAVHRELMDVRVKCVPYLPHVSGKLDGRATCSHLDLLEPLACKPVCNCLNVRVRWPKLLAKLLRGEPFMKIGRVLA